MSAGSTPLLSPRRRKLGWLSVLALVFFNVSGGPLGSEQVIAFGGPILGLGAMCAFAAVFSLPQVRPRVRWV